MSVMTHIKSFELNIKIVNILCATKLQYFAKSLHNSALILQYGLM